MNYIKAKAFIFAGALLLAPAAVFGQVDRAGKIDASLSLIENIVKRAIPLLVAIALIWFIWGLIKFLISGSEDARAQGKSMMLWGIIALFVIVSIWGIVAYIADLVGVDTGTVTGTPPDVLGL